jgi:hypothetical protein
MPSVSLYAFKWPHNQESETKNFRDIHPKQDTEEMFNEEW